MEDKTKSLERKIAELGRILKNHRHYGSDGTQKLDGNIDIKSTKMITVGRSKWGSSNSNVGLDTEIDRMVFLSGRASGSGFGYKSTNTQETLEHQEGSALSFLYGFRPPLYSGAEPGDTIGITSGESTITDSKKTFVVNELAGAYITVIGRTSGTLETHLIVSNTATVITIATTWGITENVGYVAFVPMYLGAANYPWQRVYLIGDIRFGRGASAGANVIYIKYGAGSPEGSITANVGSLYLRTDGGANTTFYVKESGTGNTGWIAK